MLHLVAEPQAQQGEVKATVQVQQPEAGQTDPQPATLTLTEDELAFLNNLMMAESGGRQYARNPRSSALGPFQFIDSTFLEVMTRYFPDVAAGKTDAQILELRTDLNIAREAALLYTRENAAALERRGLEVSAAHLRLAFLVGASGAIRVISAEPDAPLSQLLGVAVLEANPFMSHMTAGQLVERSARDAAGVLGPGLAAAGASDRPTPPAITVRCNLRLPSCRKWLALATKRRARRAMTLARPAQAENNMD